MFYVCLDCGQITNRENNQITIMHPVRDKNKIDWDNLRTLKRDRKQRGCKCREKNKNMHNDIMFTPERIQDYSRYKLFLKFEDKEDEC